MPDIEKERSVKALSRYDDIIDVRSPGEFAEDHIPGAINLPVLDNEERTEVGTLYVQTSRFLARKKGAAYVAHNVATHVETALAEKPRDYRPLIYCWRGGMRSGAMATILERIGWHTGLLDRGYKSWRRDVVDCLTADELPYRIILIDGTTGVGKTDFLQALAIEGGQVIDLEALANHKGSFFGGRFEDQPSQKLFESQIYWRLMHFDPAKPVFLEAESSKLGRLYMPKALWNGMRKAPAYELESPQRIRVQRLLGDYPNFREDNKALKRVIEKLAPYHHRDTVFSWHSDRRNRNFEALVQGLLDKHYDPSYKRAASKRGAGKAGRIIARIVLRSAQLSERHAAARTLIGSLPSG